MWQRIQTVYLALAVVMLALCCSSALVAFAPQGMGLPSTMYSLCLLGNDGTIENYWPIALLAITVFAELFTIAALAGYKNRKTQMRACTISIFLDILWYAAFAAIILLLKNDSQIILKFGAVCPIIALILTFMAKRAIKKDDNLVRSADRIR